MDSVKHFYDTFYSDNILQIDKARAEMISACFEDIPKGKKILDVGCGPGGQSYKLTAQNEVFGVDISAKALEIAKSRGIKTCRINLETEELPFLNGFFDIALVTDVLEHVFDPKAVMRKIRRVLSDDGVAILIVPNHFSWHERVKILLGGGIVHSSHACCEDYDYFHIRYFRQCSFEKFITISEFKIVKTFYDLVLDVPRGLPLFIDQFLARKFPGLFASQFMAIVNKK